MYMTFQKEESDNDLFKSSTSIDSTSLNVNRHSDDNRKFELIPLEFVDLEPMGLLSMDNPELEFHQKFIKRVADISNEDI